MKLKLLLVLVGGSLFSYCVVQAFEAAARNWHTDGWVVLYSAFAALGALLFYLGFLIPKE